MEQNSISKVLSERQKGNLRQHTFVFSLADMKKNANEVMNTFCAEHNVLSIIFSEVQGNLVYVIIYK